MKKISYALIAMVISLVFGTIIASGSLIALGGKLNSEALTNQPLGIPTVLVSCLDPLAIALEIAAIVLIVRGRKLFSGLHQRLVVLAGALYLLWGAANLFGFLPLSLISSWNGSLQTALTGQWIKAAAGLLAYAVPALLIFGMSQPAQCWLLGLGFVLTAAGSFGSVALTIGQLTLIPQSIGSQVMYVASFNANYTQFPFPLLLASSYLGGLLYLFVYAWLAIKIRTPAGEGI
ncbi:MAG: hypothetical protein M1281_09680 [Chloroflexi bacterium]|nr:hypothetical protein [Chloroflexota bacterium]